MPGPIETKVKVSTAVAGVSSALTGLGLWALQSYVFPDEVPPPVLVAVQTFVPLIVTFVAGYLAPHTPRPDLHDEFPVAVDPEDETVGGRHVLDDDPDDIPVSDFTNPTARRPSTDR